MLNVHITLEVDEVDRTRNDGGVEMTMTVRDIIHSAMCCKIEVEFCRRHESNLSQFDI